MAQHDSQTTSYDSAHKLERHARAQALVVIVSVLIAIGMLVMLGVHFSAVRAYQASFDRRMTLAQRADSAAFARRLEPWNQQCVTRAIVMQKWEQGAIYLSQGADLPAMEQLAAAYRLDVGDAELLALFKKSQAQLTLDSNFKAHIQHAHEGPGGTLRPQDLLR